MTTILQVDPLDGAIRYILRLPSNRTEALQQEIVHPIDPHALEITRDQAMLGLPGDARSFLPEARATGAMLFRILVPPLLRQALGSVRGPLLVSTSLVGIPWELLYDGEAFWGVRYALGRQLVSSHPFAISTDAAAHRRPRALVIGADPGGTLPMLAQEVEGLSRSLASRLDVVCLGGQLATARAIVDQLRDGFDLIHFCGHAVHDAAAGPALLAADGRLLAASLLQASTTGRPLVVLNACSSARRSAAENLPREQTAWGLADAFLHAGAIGVVGTLRDVVDQHALAFSRYFHARVLDGVPIGEALRQCREHALSNATLDAVPSWLAFVLYGNPGLSMQRERTRVRRTDGRGAPRARAETSRLALPAERPAASPGALLRRPRVGVALLLVAALVGAALLFTTFGAERATTDPMSDTAGTGSATRATQNVTAELPSAAAASWPAHQTFLREGFALVDAVEVDPRSGRRKYNHLWLLGPGPADSFTTLENGALCTTLAGREENAVAANGIGSREPFGDHPLSVRVRVEAETGRVDSAHAGLALLSAENRVLVFATTTRSGLIRIASRATEKDSFQMLYEGRAPSFVPGQSNELSLTSSPGGLAIYVNDVLARRVEGARESVPPRVGTVAIGGGRMCFDDFAIYRPGPLVAATAPDPLRLGGAAGWRALDTVYAEYFHRPKAVRRDPESRELRYADLWPIDPESRPWARELLDGDYCLTNASDAGSVDWVSLSSRDESLSLSQLPLTTEVKIENAAPPGSSFAGAGIIVHLRRDGERKSYDLYAIDQRGEVRLQRRTDDGFDLLYRGPAQPFHVGGYNSLGIRSSASGYELYVNDVLQERIVPDASGQPIGGDAGPAAIGIGRFCFGNFIAYGVNEKH